MRAVACTIGNTVQVQHILIGYICHTLVKKEKACKEDPREEGEEIRVEKLRWARNGCSHVQIAILLCGERGTRNRTRISVRPHTRVPPRAEAYRNIFLHVCQCTCIYIKINQECQWRLRTLTFSPSSNSPLASIQLYTCIWLFRLLFPIPQRAICATH
jgi:hypothetical protein